MKAFSASASASISARGATLPRLLTPYVPGKAAAHRTLAPAFTCTAYACCHVPRCLHASAALLHRLTYSAAGWTRSIWWAAILFTMARTRILRKDVERPDNSPRWYNVPYCDTVTVGDCLLVTDMIPLRGCGHDALHTTHLSLRSLRGHLYSGRRLR